VYTGEGNRDLNFLGKKIVVISESGPDETIIDCQGSQYDRHRGFTFNNGEDSTSELTGFMIINGYGPYSHERYEGGAIMCDSSSPLIKECIFANNTGDYQGGAVSIFKSHPKFVNCTFYGNSAAYGGGVYSRYSDPSLENCIIAFSESGSAVHGLAYLECCNLYGNAGGDWVHSISSQEDLEGNISLDPLFCNPSLLNFGLLLESPCNTYNSEICGLYGALNVCSIDDLPAVVSISFGPNANGNIVLDVPLEFHWEYVDTAEQTQYSYEIEVGIDTDWSIAEMWTSGEVISDTGFAVYAGNPLDDLTRYYLRIRVNNGTSWGGWFESDFLTHFGNLIYVPSMLPTIQDGIDAALEGDTIYVEDGIYTGIGNRDLNFLGKSISVISVNGPQDCIIDCEGSPSQPHRGFVFVNGEDSTSHLKGLTIRNGYGPHSHGHFEGGAILIDESSPLIRECVFVDNIGEYQGGALCLFYSDAIIRKCTFVGNSAGYGAAVFSNYSDPILENCIIAYNGQGGDVVYGSAALQCCNIYGNPGGDWEGSIYDQYGQNGNISLDPLFCDLANDDFHLSLGSPCSPYGNDSCGLIGALAPNCNLFDVPLALNIKYGTPPRKDTVFAPEPEIFWMYLDTGSTVQSAYEIEVGIDDDWDTAEIWSSGQVQSSDSQTVYSGLPLQNHTQYYLRIRVSNGTVWGSWRHSDFYTILQHSFNVPDDYPTIQAAIDSSINGDTIIVADGIYQGEGNRDIDFKGKEILVISENGPEHTVIDCEGSLSEPHRGFVFLNNEDHNSILRGFTIKNGYGPYSHYHNEGGAILCDHASPLIQECVFVNNIADYQGGAVCLFSSHARFINCTFAANSANYGSGLYSNNSDPILENCIIAHNLVGSGVSGEADLYCCNVYGNEGGDWNGYIASQYGQYGNISSNPYFCDLSSEDLSLSLISPCGPYLSDSCGLMGALGPGCDYGVPMAVNIEYGSPPDNDTVLESGPMISWEYIDTAATQQSSFEIEIGTDDDWSAAEMWATGSIQSADSQIVYGGLALTDRTQYYLRIRVNNGTSWGAWQHSRFIAILKHTFNVPDDFATIQEAVDTAISGDTIIVADGVYTGDGNRDINLNGRNLILISENGPTSTIIDCQGTESDPHRAFNFINEEDSTCVIDGFTIRNGHGLYSHNHYEAGAILCDKASPVIKNCIIADNYGGYQGGALVCFSSAPRMENCTFISNAASYGGAIFSRYADPILENCLIAFGTEGEAIYGGADLSCTNIYGNSEGDWTGNIVDQADQNGNLSADPLFCDLDSSNYSVSYLSPCAPEYNSCGELIGAVEVADCGPEAVILIDRSGSMSLEDPQGRSRLSRAKSIAHYELDKLLEKDDEKFPLEYKVAIMYFNSDGIVLHEDFSTDSAGLHTAIDAIPGPKHDTPLAAAMCQAVCSVENWGPFRSTVITFTDGLENESQNYDMCGPCSTCSEFQESGWNYDCQLFGTPDNCTEWQICIGYGLVSKSYNYAHYFGETLDPFAKGALEDLPDFEFIRYTAEESGGQFSYHSDLAAACGDANSDGGINVSDAVFIINHVFLGGPAPQYFGSADTNCDGDINVSDAVFLINYIFIDGAFPCDIDEDGNPDC
ncbi:MAG: VWA domain-containing protein, partial [candidate division Zixibacteria bacterium]|nr:VWA domain-containing protein [candidate division Zixibacteria bacterium]